MTTDYYGYKYCTGCQVHRPTEGGKWVIKPGMKRWKCAVCVNKTALSWINRTRAAARRDEAATQVVNSQNRADNSSTGAVA